jgi:hypothetical protein
LVGHVGYVAGHLEHLSVGHAILSLRSAGAAAQSATWWGRYENGAVDASTRCGCWYGVTIVLEIAVPCQSWIPHYADTVVVLLFEAVFDTLLKTRCGFAAHAILR